MEERSTSKMTSLFRAAIAGKSTALLGLLQKGAFSNNQDSHGRTPLHKACLSRCGDLATAVVDLLPRWGADETAVDSEGRTPAEHLHDVVPVSGLCSQESIDRARLLFARAPADRAWRRRGWLVMLRARASTARIASLDGGGGARVETSVAAASGTGEGCKVTRREGATRSDKC
eukprot:g5622.t1